jgi:iron(III) transport system ATP-binding protein
MIRLEGLRKDFKVKEGVVPALHSIDLKIESREFFVLLGPSGSGKSTILRCIAGIEDPDGGDMWLGDRLIYSMRQNVRIPPESRGLGMVFQSYAVWPHMTVFDNVALPLRYGANKIESSAVRDRVMYALSLVQLEKFADRPVPFLSGGQQQRVALARALAIKPVVLLMDEPLSNLDARLREEVRHQIRTVTREVGVTVLYVTHDQEEALALADRIAVMDHGRILQIATPDEVFHNPSEPLVADFFGEMNWLSGKADGAGRLDTPVGALNASTQLSGAVKVGIRPCNIQVSDQPTQRGNEIPGQIVDEVFLGEQVQYTVNVSGDLKLEVKAPNRGRDRRKDRNVWCHVPQEDIFVYPADSGSRPAA